jgi:hypothetical protein
MKYWKKHGWKIGLIGCVLGIGEADGKMVVRRIDQPPLAAWQSGAWNSARITLDETTQALPGSAATDEAALHIAATFSGKGFQFFGVNPSLTSMPGRLQKISLQVKGGQKGCSLALAFKDAQGRTEVNGRKLEYGLKSLPGQWTPVSFTIPPEWEQPVQFTGLSGHNWGAQKEAGTADWWVQGVTVETDLDGLTDSAQLLRAGISGGGVRNVFIAGEPVRFFVNMDNWTGNPVTGLVSVAVTDFSGQTLTQFTRNVKCAGMISEPINLQLQKFGLYRVALNLAVAGRTIKESSQLAFVPAPTPLTQEQKMVSPYALVIHGGGTPSYEAIARLGTVWIRDYAYTWSWMARARGENGRYEGWPWYPKMDEQIKKSGLMLLPCLQDSMKGTVGKGGPLTPDAAWRRQLVDILRAFPQYVAWEIDNEYDLHFKKEEAARDWVSYKNYHQVFAQGVKFMNEDLLTVEQGSAGVFPDRIRMLIASGAFDQIDVVNAHFYCGTTAPELSARNANTGGDRDDSALISDLLRDLVAAADSDGLDRQTWITEFGWDTLAGHIVTEAEQAAFLQRGWMVGLQAGIDKMFWYWELDTKKPPKVFFDGCGIFDPKDEPKPAAAAMAAMAHLMPLPRPVGTFDVGSNTMGHVFRNGDQLVAAVFQLIAQDPAPTVRLPSGKTFDQFANPLARKDTELGLAPVWLTGLQENSAWYRQTAFDLASAGFQDITAGDQVDVIVRTRGNRKDAVKGSYRVETPQGITLEPPQGDLAAAVGATNLTTLKLTIASSLPGGTYQVRVLCREGETEKTLALTLKVGKAATLSVEPLPGKPGTAEVRATLFNISHRTLPFTLEAAVPASWQVEPAQLTLDAVPGGTKTDVVFKVTWQPGWKAGENARIRVRASDGDLLAEHGLMPGSIQIPKLSGLKMDGDLKDWPTDARWADWSVASTRGAPRAEFHLGYSEAGLHVAVRVQDSPAKVTDPTWFWAADCLEVLLDAQDNKQARKAYNATDHQFWFCPMVAGGKVYAGRWKRHAEIPATEFDLPDVPGASRREGSGYVMEFTIPASRIQGWSGKSGDHLGLNLNLNVPTGDSQREVFWLTPKDQNAGDHPERWGTVILK